MMKQPKGNTNTHTIQIFKNKTYSPKNKTKLHQLGIEPSIPLHCISNRLPNHFSQCSSSQMGDSIVFPIEFVHCCGSERVFLVCWQITSPATHPLLVVVFNNIDK